MHRVSGAAAGAFADCRRNNSDGLRALFERLRRVRSADHRQVHRTILIHVDAPAKPAEGAACNGCGVCCATDPCPAGALVSRRLHGGCAALIWREAEAVYRCGLIDDAARWLPAALVRAAPVLARAARRLVAAGAGCDCSLEVAPAADINA